MGKVSHSNQRKDRRTWKIEWQTDKKSETNENYAENDEEVAKKDVGPAAQNRTL